MSHQRGMGQYTRHPMGHPVMGPVVSPTPPPHNHKSSLNHDEELNPLVYEPQSDPNQPGKKHGMHLGWLGKIIVLGVIAGITVLILKKTGVIGKKGKGLRGSDDDKTKPTEGTGGETTEGTGGETTEGTGGETTNAPGGGLPGGETTGSTEFVNPDGTAAPAIDTLVVGANTFQLVVGISSISVATVLMIVLYALSFRSQFAIVIYICGVIVTSLALAMQNSDVLWVGFSALVSSVLWMLFVKYVFDLEYYFRDLYLLTFGIVITAVGSIALGDSDEEQALAVVLTVLGVLMTFSALRMIWRRRFWGGSLTREGVQSRFRRLEEMLSSVKKSEKERLKRMFDRFRFKHRDLDMMNFSESPVGIGARDFQTEADEIEFEMNQARDLAGEAMEEARRRGINIVEEVEGDLFYDLEEGAAAMGRNRGFLSRLNPFNWFR